MSTANSDVKKSTKELLIEAAFSFYSTPHYEDFSMSQLAAKIGISKPAIYKHFASKEAVVAAMHNHFYDLIASRLIEIQKNCSPEKKNAPSPLFADLIDFFADNPQYINYFISCYSEDCNYEQVIRNEMIKHGVANRMHEIHGGTDIVYQYAHSLYCGLTLLFFIKIREKAVKESGKKATIKKFGPALISFVMNGLKGIFSQDDELFPQNISPERREQLDKLCRIEPGILPEENKIFKAFANVIIKHNIRGVTVERIAAELNMAKSSLYFYFENKNQMISSLVTKELSLLETLVNENISEAQTLAEYLYITMRTELEFFKEHKSIIPMCGWIFQSTTEDPFKFAEEHQNGNKWEKVLEKSDLHIDFGFPFHPSLISFWAGCLPFGLTVMAQKHCFSSQQTETILETIFNFIINGINELK